MEGIIDLHHDIMFFIIWITIFVCWLLFDFVIGQDNLKGIAQLKTENADTFSDIDSVETTETTTPTLPNKIQHNTTIEIVWTFIPCGILLVIAIPSFSLLYAIEDLNVIDATIKVIGNQWFWTYEIPGLNLEKKFDSVMIPEEDLIQGSLRLLEVDNRLKLPVETQLRLFVTASDVLHSWAVPSLGVKIDACPGRVNQVALWIKRTGVYYGQCSEICGVQHAFMPIVVDAVDTADFLEWFNPTKKSS